MRLFRHGVVLFYILSIGIKEYLFYQVIEIKAEDRVTKQVEKLTEAIQ
jgi:hypothetical protein